MFIFYWYTHSLAFPTPSFKAFSKNIFKSKY